MRSYKLVLVLKTSLSDSERKKLIETLKTWLKGLKILKEEDFGQKPLSYSIKKEAAGYFLELELETEAIPFDFEKKLLANESILRHLLIRSN